MNLNITDEQAKEILRMRDEGTVPPDPDLVPIRNLDKNESNDSSLQKNSSDIDLSRPQPGRNAPALNASANVYGDATVPTSHKPVELGKADRWISEQKISQEELNEMGGWFPVPIDQLPTRGMFYPDGTTFFIREASVFEIRAWSMIDVNDGFTVDDLLNKIIERCVRIRFPGQVVQWQNLIEIDRLYLILAVRDRTFKNGENKLTMNITCNKCGKQNEVELGTFNRTDPARLNNVATIKYFDLDQRLWNFYDNSKKCFSLIDKNGVHVQDIFIPSLGIATFIKNYLTSKRDDNRINEIDQAFLRISMFLFDNWRTLNERTYNDMNQSTFDWDIRKISIISGVIDKIFDAYQPKVSKECSECGMEVTAPIQFQNGLKSLFLIPDIFGELLGS